MTQKLFLKILLTSFFLFFVTLESVFAARIFMEAPEIANKNKEALVVFVYLDSEKDTVSGISGSFTFPSDLFDLDSISTTNGVVSTWMSSPHIAQEKYFDGKTHITFEGIIPGGFSGVRSPYYKGFKPGLIFKVNLIPKNKGFGNFVLENIELHAYDESATKLASIGTIQSVTVPELAVNMPTSTHGASAIYSSTLAVSLAQSDLIANNAWYVNVYEDSTVHSVDHIEIAESKEYDPNNVASFLWRTVTTPFVLSHQSRSYYVHVKVVYTDTTFAIKTIAPVENSSSISFEECILISIFISILLLSYYAKNILRFVSKYKHTKV